MTTASIDRWNARREEPRLVEELRADPRTRVLMQHEGTVPFRDGGLVLVAPGEVPEAAQWALIGADGRGPILLAVPVERPTALPQEVRWLGLRQVGAALEPEAAEILMTALTLGAWLHDAPFCPRCGSAAELISAGWARRCTGCGREHFPRTDPAVIVAIESADGERLLLGANALWQGKMFSCFAGFVEAGESLEATVHREIEEEAGVLLRDVRFFGSQPWPFPRSLMIGFHARAVAEQARPDGEEIVEVRWFTREEIASALAGEGPVGMPGGVSIARRLIEDWLGRHP